MTDMKLPPPAKDTLAFLAAILPPKAKTASTDTDTLYALIVPLHDVLERVRTRFARVELLRRKADAAEESPEIFNSFEQFKQTAKAALRLCDELEHGLDSLTDTSYQLDRYAREFQTSLDTRGERLTRPSRGPDAAPRS